MSGELTIGGRVYSRDGKQFSNCVIAKRRIEKLSVAIKNILQPEGFHAGIGVNATMAFASAGANRITLQACMMLSLLNPDDLPVH